MTYIRVSDLAMEGVYALNCKCPPAGPYRAPATVLALNSPNLDKSPVTPWFFSEDP